VCDVFFGDTYVFVNVQPNLLIVLLFFLAQVIDWVFSHTLHDHLPATPVTTSGPVPTPASKYLLLVSGLQVGNPGAASAGAASEASGASSELSAQLLMDFVAGRLGGQRADIDVASKIVR